MRYSALAKNKLVFNKQRWRLFALLAHKKPLSMAFNDLNKSHPVNGWGRGTHAEVKCIRKSARRNLERSTLYVVRIDKVGNYKLAKPCSNCLDLIKKSGIKRIVFSTEKGFVKMKL